jgi:hypothetical protein
VIAVAPDIGTIFSRKSHGKWCITKEDNSTAPVTYACNPSYSGGRDQEDLGLKPARANSLWDYFEKNPSQKRARGMAQDVPKFKPQSSKKKKKGGKWWTKLQACHQVALKFKRNLHEMCI